MEDITLRAIRILKTVDYIAAEDTRHTAKLLNYHGIQTPVLSYHEHNERKRTAELIQELINGKSIALVSDAGTPSVSDPGYRLVKEAIANSIPVVPIPGPSAVMTALCVSGLPTDTFRFLGFPPRQLEKRRRLLESLIHEQATLIFYESPHRISNLITDIIQLLGDRVGVLSREMTKIHEEFLRGNLSEILEKLCQRAVVKGECTLLVQGISEPHSISLDQIRNEIVECFKRSDMTIPLLSKELSEKYHLPKKMIYQEALIVKRNMEHSDYSTS